jgi:hypothetical protein
VVSAYWCSKLVRVLDVCISKFLSVSTAANRQENFPVKVADVATLCPLCGHPVNRQRAYLSDDGQRKSVRRRGSQCRDAKRLAIGINQRSHAASVAELLKLLLEPGTVGGVVFELQDRSQSISGDAKRHSLSFGGNECPAVGIPPTCCCRHCFRTGALPESD